MPLFVFRDREEVPRLERVFRGKRAVTKLERAGQLADTSVVERLAHEIDEVARLARGRRIVLEGSGRRSEVNR